MNTTINAPIYNILIVESSLSFTLELEMMLENLGHHTIGCVDNSKSALDFIYSQEIDVILMGICIKGDLSGIAFSEQIKHLNIPIILMTSMIDHNKKDLAKAANTIGFFIKPIHPFTLESTIDFALRSSKNIFKKKSNSSPSLFHDFIFAKSDNKNYHKICIRDIQCLEAAGNYSDIHTSDKKYMSSFKFKDLENIFYPKGFIRVHRSFIINTQHIRSINTEENLIQLENLNTIPLSRTYKQQLLNKIRQKMI